MVTNKRYSLRTTNARDYRSIADLSLLRSQKISYTNKLYPINVFERDGSRVKIHYEGYNSSYDEWREDTEIVSLSPNPEQSTSGSQISIHQLYSLYKELGIKIKQSLTCGRKQSPTAKVQMGFDYILFVGGL